MSSFWKPLFGFFACWIRRNMRCPLAPLVRQEILYRLLSGPSGSRLLEICRNGSPSNRIAEATAWILKHFAEGFMVGELAHHVGMSPSSFHQHFKAVTGMTPIQYQKRIRLHEARRSLFFDSIDIGEASFRVGYQSHSQFSKDYRQYFGRLPKDDVIRALAQRSLYRGIYARSVDASIAVARREAAGRGPVASISLHGPPITRDCITYRNARSRWRASPARIIEACVARCSCSNSSMSVKPSTWTRSAANSAAPASIVTLLLDSRPRSGSGLSLRLTFSPWAKWSSCLASLSMPRSITTATASCVCAWSVSFDLDWPTLIELSSRWVGAAAAEVGARELVRRQLATVQSALVKPHDEYLGEDYCVVRLDPIPNSDAVLTAEQLLEHCGSNVAQIVRGETMPLAAEEQAHILASRLSYYPVDLLVAGWTAAFVYDTGSGAEATVQLIEYANTQLLEFRFYDEMLTGTLREVYRRIDEGTGLLKRWRLASQAERFNTIRLDVHELTERTDNAAKFLSDMFAARLYQLVATRVGVPDYRRLVDEKLQTAADLYHFMTERVHQHSALMLETIVVIILIIDLILPVPRQGLIASYRDWGAAIRRGVGQAEWIITGQHGRPLESAALGDPFCNSSHAD